MHSSEIRILIVERNPRIRDFLRREFSKRSFLVEGAASGGELVTKLNSREQVHLVILDVNTSDGHGRDLLQLIVTSFSDIPIILHTYLEDLSEDPSLQQVTAMVEKSGNPEDLTRVVTLVLESLYPDLMESTGLEGSHV